MKWLGINRTIHLSVAIVSLLAAKISSCRHLPRFRRIPTTTMLARLQSVRRVYWMTYVAATAEKIPSGHGISFSGPIALVIVALASGVAAWTAYPVTWVSDSVSSKEINASSFDDRFLSDSGSNLLPTYFPLPVVQSLPSELEIKFQQAKERLAQKLQSRDWRVAPVEEPAPSSVAAVPLPRPRPRYCRSFPICSRPVSRLRLFLQMVGSLAIGRISRLLATTISRPSMISRRALFTCQTG